MWRNSWLVARREYAENVKTKAFIIGVLAFPVILALAAGVPILLEKQAGAVKPFAVLATGDHGVRDHLRLAFDAAPQLEKKFRWDDSVPADAPPAELDARVARGELFAWVELPADVVQTGRASYAARNLADTALHEWFAQRLREIVRDVRFDREGVDPYAKARILGAVELKQRSVSETGASREATTEDLLRSYAPVVFVYLLWVAVMTIAQLLLTNVIEEKSTRVIEVLLSSVSPGELMGGKIAGTAATGLTMLGCWIATLLAFLQFGLPLVLGAGVDAGRLLDAAVAVAGPVNLACFLGYFLAGFLLYAALFAAIGSVVSSIKEAQNLMTPIVMVMMVPLLTMIFVTRNPHEPLGVVLSYIPPFTPFLMMNRAAAIPPAPWWEILLSGLLMVASVWAAFRLAGRVFRVGILMTGKPPTPREIWRIALSRR